MDKYIRGDFQDREIYGRITGEAIEILEGPFWLGAGPTGTKVALSEVTLLAPVQPSKIILVGLNYHRHVQHSQSADKVPDHPLIFMKPPTAIIGPGDNIVYPDAVDRVDYEAELGVVIGREGYKISLDNAMDFVFGYTCVNDVTARKLQKIDGQWTRAKGFNTFCPVGPQVVTGIDASDLSVEAYLNGERRQSGRTSELIFSIPVLIEFISSFMTLLPGDLISTGTPEGIDPMERGDTIEVRVEQAGSLINKIV